MRQCFLAIHISLSYYYTYPFKYYLDHVLCICVSLSRSKALERVNPLFFPVCTPRDKWFCQLIEKSCGATMQLSSYILITYNSCNDMSKACL